MDAGSSSITIALGAADENGKLLLADVITKPMQGIARGEISNRMQVSASIGEAIREVEEKHNIRISDVYSGVSGRQIKCTNHDYYVFVGEQSDGEVRREDVMMLHEGMNNVQAEDGVRILDRIPQCYVIDGRNTVKDPVGVYGKKLESTFNFVLGSSTLIDRMEKTLLALNISTRRTFANAVASAEAVLMPEDKEMGVAVVDLGAGTTDLCVWHDNAVRFVRGIPFGASDINNDIHQQGILEKRVEDLKKEFGRAMVDSIDVDFLIKITGRSPREKQDISQKNLAIIIENRLREIIGFVMAEIGDSGYAGRLKGGIMLTGGGARLAGIDELFRRETGMEVRVALPDVNVANESVEFAQDPANATVIGLLLKALEQGKGQSRASGYERTDSGNRTDRGTGGYEKPEPPVERPPVGGNKPEPEPPHSGGETLNDKLGGTANDTGLKGDPAFEDDDDGDSGKKGFLGGWFRKVGKKMMDNIMPETLDGDEDI